LEALPEPIRELVRVHLGAVRLDEDKVAVACPTQLPPRLERAGDARRERPRTRVVGLVLLEPEDAAGDIAEDEGHGLARSKALTAQEAEQDAPLERDGLACHEGGILGRVEE